MLISGSKLSAIRTFLSRDLISEKLRWWKNQNQLTWLFMGVLITMKNTFPIEKSLPFFFFFYQLQWKFWSFHLSWSAGRRRQQRSWGKAGKFRSSSEGLSLPADIWGMFFFFKFLKSFYFFMKHLNLLNRENLDRGVKSARMDREARRQVKKRRTCSN